MFGVSVCENIPVVNRVKIIISDPSSRGNRRAGRVRKKRKQNEIITIMTTVKNKKILCAFSRSYNVRGMLLLFANDGGNNCP